MFFCIFAMSIVNMNVQVLKIFGVLVYSLQVAFKMCVTPISISCFVLNAAWYGPIKIPGYTSNKLISLRAIWHWISHAQLSMWGNLPHKIFSSSSPLIAAPLLKVLFLRPPQERHWLKRYLYHPKVITWLWFYFGFANAN
jgi:hypothetical protein